MNRLRLDFATDDPADNSAIQLEQARFEVPSFSSLPHALFAPLHYERNYAYPLVVWLHGPGDDERQLQRIMPLVSMRNYVAIGPRASSRMERNLLGYCWNQTDRDIEIAEQRVLDCIDLAHRRFNVASSRVFLAGYDCGGTMALRIGLMRPGQFAGIISIGGPLPSGNAPFANLEQARCVPILIAHGRDSTVYTIEQSCKELRLFHAGGFSVTIRQYPAGDELTTQMLHDMDVWTMEQVTGASVSRD
jgi:phospholipase/carboxylesterase